MKIEFLLNINEFEWDKWNRDKIHCKHKVGVFECEEVFFNEPLTTIPDNIHSKSEQRFRALGVTNSGRLLFIVFTIRNRKIRVISARDMNKKERRIYYEKA